eukprot:6415219-Prorocentrum_lima.AAC.1
MLHPPLPGLHELCVFPHLFVVFTHGLPEEYELQICHVDKVSSSFECHKKFPTFTILIPQCSLLA